MHKIVLMFTLMGLVPVSAGSAVDSVPDGDSSRWRATTGTPLEIYNENPVRFDGSLGPTGGLQTWYDGDNLALYDYEVEVVHATASTVQIRFYNFKVGRATWEMSAYHFQGTTPVVWSQAANYAYFNLDIDGDPITVYPSASNGSSSSGGVPLILRPKREE
jgi:hypothetical protein